MVHLRDAICRAYGARQHLHDDPNTDVYRLFHGYSEGAIGLEIDRYGDALVMQSKGADVQLFEEATRCIEELADFPLVVAKQRGQTPVALRGQLPTEAQTVTESGLLYSVELWAAQSPGLYLDARPARSWLRENSQGRRVLNLFSFAGSLGVAAMAGGALSVTHVDTQKRALKRCETNHALNKQQIDRRDLAREDVQRHLRTAATRSRRYGGIILDPPPVVPGSRQAKELSPAALARRAMPILESGSWVLCFFHHDQRSWDELESGVCEAANAKLERIWRGRSGIDFPEPNERRSLRLSAFQLP